MTMQNMCDYLSTKGFIVRKRYDSGTKAYVFDVVKGVHGVRKYFKYPVDVKPVVRDRIQREFLDDIIKQFNMEQKEKGEKMKNNGIKWRVEEITSQTDMDGFAFYAHLVGTPDGLFIGSMRDIKDDIQERLNGEATLDIRWPKQNPFVRQGLPAIKKVIFNEPATIVLWADDTKTVVTCQNGDVFDPEKGLAMAITKKTLGNKGNYCNEIKKWLPKEKKTEIVAHWIRKYMKLNDATSVRCSYCNDEKVYAFNCHFDACDIPKQCLSCGSHMTAIVEEIE